MNFSNKKLLLICSTLLIAFYSLPVICEERVDLNQNFEFISNYPDQGTEVNTLRSELFFVKNSASAWARMSPLYKTFYQKRSTDSISILPNKPELKYNYWLQEEPADLVVIIPGTGESYVDLTPTSFANMYYEQGYSAIILSNAFNWEFMQSAATVWTPGFTPYDAKDVKSAIDKILIKLEKEYPGKFKRKILCGSSMGALHTLFIADINRKTKDNTFSKYIAINPPVDLLYAMNIIDEYYAIGGTWPKDIIQEKVRSCILSYMKMLKGIDPGASPISGGINRRQSVKVNVDDDDKHLFQKDEAQFLIGLSFHMNLSEVIYSIYSRHDTGVIKAKKAWYDRREIYAEIDTFNFSAYLRKFLIKDYEKRLRRKVTIKEVGDKSSLFAIEPTLKNSDKIRIIHNHDDFLLNKGNLTWLRIVLGKKLTVFKHGGHLGNLYTKEMQNKILTLSQ